MLVGEPFLVVSYFPEGNWQKLTFIDIRLLSVLFGKRVLHDDIIQAGLLEILLAWLFIRSMLRSVLVHWLEGISLPTMRVYVTVEEFVCLLSDFQKMARRVAARQP